MSEILVFDAACGSGKTTRMMKIMQEMHTSEKIIYVTPLLSECHRIAGTEFVESDVYKRPIMMDETEYFYVKGHPLRDKRFRHPLNIKGSTKLEDVAYLAEHGCNIVSTHSLFANFNQNIAESLVENEYTLFLDEVVSVYETAEDILSLKEAQQLLRSKMMTIDADGITLRFNREYFQYTENTRYDTVANLCDLGQLLMIDDKIVLWEFPLDILKSFKKIYIATYLFEGSQLSAFLKTNKLPYTTMKFGKRPSEYKHLIDIVSNKKLNSIGDDYYSLSSTNLTNTKVHEVLRKNLFNFFTNITKALKHERLWTTYKSATRAVSAGKYSGSWLAYNTRATNDYRETWAVAYMMNLFINPMIEKVLSYKNVKVNEEEYALSEMIQFIFRSRIREGKNIVLYVPSLRMREMLIKWLNDEFEVVYENE